MAPRRTERLKKHTIRLRQGDVADLDAAFPSIGHNAVIRQLVSDAVDKLKANRVIPELPLSEELK